MFDGAIGIDYLGAQGATGSKFSTSYYNAYGMNYTIDSLLTYDTLYLYASILNGMIEQGGDYNSGKELINTLRTGDLTGASGKIKFSDGSNGRSAYGYNIMNYQKGEIVNVLLYNPLSPNLFTSVNNNTIYWAQGTTSAPVAVWPTVFDCPFAETMTTISPGGVGIVISIGATLFFMTLGLSFFSYKK